MKKALVLTESKQLPEYIDYSFDVKPAHDEVYVNLETSALNRRDYWITKGLYPNIETGVILGSDGMGCIDGRRVLINPGLYWGEKQAYQSADFQVLGLPRHGTFSQKVLVPSSHLYDVPAHLSDSEAAAMPLAGVTAFRVLFSQCKVSSSDTVLISGVGGGVAHFVLLFALARGARVIVTSGSEEKIQKAKTLGAKDGVNYKSKEWVDQLMEIQPNGFDVIIDSAAGSGFKHFISLSAPGARIGIYGGTQGKIDTINPQILFWRQISIHGSTMGSPSDFKSMLEFVDTHEIRPVVDAVLPMSDYYKGFQMMSDSNQFGKIVFNNNE